MADFNLADSYKAEQISLGPDIMRLRQGSLNKLSQALDGSQKLFLVRLYYGLPNTSDDTWFKEAFGGSDDPSFSMIDNHRETAILAGAILGSKISGGDELSALLVLAAAAGGNRKPAISSHLLQIAIDSLASESVEQRKHQKLPIDAIKPLAAPKVSVESLNAVGSFPLLLPILQESSDQSASFASQVGKQVLTVLKEVSLQHRHFREEIDMLWWVVGAWSRTISQPFASQDPGYAALLAGIDVSDLSQTIAGPIAAPALLQRALANGKKAKTNRVTLLDVVDSVPEAQLPALRISESVAQVLDLCPILGAMKKRQEIGPSPAWHGSFRKSTQLDETIQFTPIELAIQVMRERTIIGEL